MEKDKELSYIILEGTVPKLARKDIEDFSSAPSFLTVGVVRKMIRVHPP